MQNWTSEAIAIANDRVQQLEDKVLPKLIQHDNSLKCFADPSFQITLRKAQISVPDSKSRHRKYIPDHVSHSPQQHGKGLTNSRHSYGGVGR